MNDVNRKYKDSVFTLLVKPLAMTMTQRFAVVSANFRTFLPASAGGPPHGAICGLSGVSHIFNRENMKRCGTLHHEMRYSLLRDAEVFGKRHGGILDFAVLFFNHEPARKNPPRREGFSPAKPDSKQSGTGRPNAGQTSLPARWTVSPAAKCAGET
jgi:hypothetical protein